MDRGDGHLRREVRRRGGDPDAHPCVHLAYYSTQDPSCRDLHDAQDCPDVIVTRFGASSEYGIPIKDGGTSHVRIRFCPWCGLEL